MSTITALATTAALIGEPTRTAMLVALMDGRALTAGELATAAGVAAPTASGHLSQLLDAGLLALERQGRHRYYRLAGPTVAATIENLMELAGTLDLNVPRRPIVTGPRDRALRRARLCYDHLAGEVAVAIADDMVRCGRLDFARDGGALTPDGVAFLAGLEIAIDGGAPALGPTFCRPCLDWSERRPHIAGAVGRALYRTMAARDWLRPAAAGRAVAITPPGLAMLERHFGLATG